MAEPTKEFKPYIAPDSKMKEFTPRAIILGGIFGILFGAATVYLALKAVSDLSELREWNECDSHRGKQYWFRDNGYR